MNISSFDELMGHPNFGASWEGMALENIITGMNDFEPFFYRTSAGAELDLLLVKGQQKVGVEFKASMAPKPLKGFWHAIEDLNLIDVNIIALHINYKYIARFKILNYFINRNTSYLVQKRRIK